MNNSCSVRNLVTSRLLKVFLEFSALWLNFQEVEAEELGHVSCVCIWL